MQGSTTLGHLHEKALPDIRVGDLVRYHHGRGLAEGRVVQIELCRHAIVPTAQAYIKNENDKIVLRAMALLILVERDGDRLGEAS